MREWVMILKAWSQMPTDGKTGSVQQKGFPAAQGRWRLAVVPGFGRGVPEGCSQASPCSAAPAAAETDAHERYHTGGKWAVAAARSLGETQRWGSGRHGRCRCRAEPRSAQHLLLALRRAALGAWPAPLAPLSWQHGRFAPWRVPAPAAVLRPEEGWSLPSSRAGAFVHPLTGAGDTA